MSTTKQRVLGGGFTMSDTHGFPFTCFVSACREKGIVPSYPHYFAEAIEHGWDDKTTFERMLEAYHEDTDRTLTFEEIKTRCITLFMSAHKSLPPGATAIEATRKMRLDLEAGGTEVVE